MRLLIIILTFWTSLTYGQGNKDTQSCEKTIDTLTNREVYKTADIQPKVIGGMDKLYSEMSKTLKVPKNTDPNQTKIIVAFIVEPSGEITGLRTIRKIERTTVDNELLQLLKKYKWVPGTCKGIKVPTIMMLVTVLDHG